MTPDGHYEFLRMLFGSMNANAKLVIWLRNILERIENVDMYIDDIIIFTNTWQEHLETLNLLFKKWKHANITVKPSKCVFGENYIDFIGHTIKDGYMTPNSDNLTRIQDAKRPISKKQVAPSCNWCYIAPRISKKAIPRRK